MKPPIGRDTKLCMSLSARPGNAGSMLHNRLYELLGLDYVYKSFSTADLPAAIGGIRALGIRGCAVSMPFKEAVIPLIDAMEPSASAIDSVNTIVNDDGHLTGYNTDFVAVRDLLVQRRIDPALPFAVRGSGGMAKAVVAALRDCGFGEGVVVARNREAGQSLAEQYGYAWQAEVPARGAPLLVNVTPLGMAGADEAAMSFDDAQIAGCEIAFDVVAQPAMTPFILAADKAGKKIISGAEVIVLQAVEQFVLYTGIRPDPEMIRDAALAAHGPQVAERLIL
ncbi:shikimate 5-dehydrogenase [Novosphingobium barchaimii LL02]|uniref:Shikimate 5-dehydrogenase n=1 Tax=Novosphingobium barchaimii LL02 TaxID=1114963 RepID=A0A0J7XX29_9SPHN|nr:shikimate 5-dehydrogenase [Novosphingobium barchaimii]KMS56266.1 shikimate 5-dehydrogenase [Novosphingobium barchaimii LL02]